MATRFGTVATTDSIDVVSHPRIDDYVDSTQAFWCFLPGGTGGFRLLSWKGITSSSSTASLSVQVTSSDTVAAFFWNGGSYDNVASTSTFPVDRWVYCAVTQRKSPTQIRIFMGDLMSPVREVTYGTIDITGGSPQANSGQPFVIGNGDGSAGDLPFQGTIAYASYWPWVMMPREMDKVRKMTRPSAPRAGMPVVPGIFIDTGMVSGTTVFNYGTGGPGVLSGTTQFPTAPVCFLPQVGMRRKTRAMMAAGGAATAIRDLIGRGIIAYAR